MDEDHGQGQTGEETLVEAEQVFADVGVDINDASVELCGLWGCLPDQFQKFFDLIYFLMDPVFVLALGVEDDLLLQIVPVDEDPFI